jgi:Mlc titration factor MtfA (ptsG expression regulator)
MSILAMRKPAISAIALLICLALLEGLGAFTDGLRGVVLVAQRFAIQNIGFAWGYVYVWASRGTHTAGDGTQTSDQG